MGSRPDPRGPRTWIFWLITAVYLAILFIGACSLKFFNPRDTPLAPNEWGDLLAGAFSPLAFLWLIYTSLSQSAELKLQHEELSANNIAQIEQYKAMQLQASAQRAQADVLVSQARDVQMARRVWVRLYLTGLLEFHHQIINHTAGMGRLKKPLTIPLVDHWFSLDQLPGISYVEEGLNQIHTLPPEIQESALNVLERLWAARRSCDSYKNAVRERGTLLQKDINSFRAMAQSLATDAFNVATSGRALLRASENVCEPGHPLFDPGSPDRDT